MIKINDDVNIFYPLNLPPRKQQIDGLNFTKSCLNNSKKFILMNLPTGIGKSYYTIMFINYYLNFVNENAKFDILTNSKILQKQYIKEYPFITNLEGRSNYQCDPHDTNCEIGKEICKTLGPMCKLDCPYDYAKEQWINSKISLTNFHLFNTFALYAKHNLVERNANVLIIDEAHDFESVFCDYITTNLCSKNLKKYGFELKEIQDFDENISRINTIEKYIGFLENKFIQQIKKLILLFNSKVSRGGKSKLLQDYTNYLNYCTIQLSKFVFFIEEYHKKPENWILDITKLNNDKMYSGILLETKPVWGNFYIKDLIWENYDHVIFMSGSILDKDTFSYINGLDEELTEYYEIPSPFPIENRLIYYMKIGKMSYNQKKETFKKQLIYIDKILKRNKKHKGIIHCGSYEFADWLKTQYFNERLLFHTPDNRDEILEKHINANYPSVIVSPSMISGVDLKDDLSRFQIIMKIPYPFLGSNKIKRRQKLNPTWYTLKTIQDLIQMYGRSIRSQTDTCETYILDSNFSDVLRYNSHLIPDWFINAIVTVKNS
jgi:Rad3-related DNA helicase